MHMMSILCSAVDAVSSGSRFIVFKSLNIKYYYVDNAFASKFSLRFIADFFNTGARAPILHECASCLLVWKTMQFGCTGGWFL